MIQGALGMLWFCLPAGLAAQSQPAELKMPVKELHEHHHHHHLKNEIGLSVAPTYSFIEDEQALGLGLHLHYVRGIKHTKFGVGLGYERLLGEHAHHTVGLLGSYRPTDRLSVVLSPGVSFEHNDIGKSHFALHIETAYEFELGRLGIGPMLELGYDPEGIHVSLGIHLGLGF